MSTSSSTSPSTRALAFLGGVASLALILQGCAVYDRSADVRAYWTFAGLGCVEADVEHVQVLLEARDGSTRRNSGIVPCEQGVVEFEDLEPGRYWITVLGFPASGAYASWDLDLSFELHGGFNEFTLELVPVGSL